MLSRSHAVVPALLAVGCILDLNAADSSTSDSGGVTTAADPTADPSEGATTEGTTATSTTDAPSTSTTMVIPADCGDGNLDPGEQCDDGNKLEDDACLNNCVLATCGDGVPQAGTETCDEGTANGTYGHCLADCSGQGPFCGDGERNGPEDCDDANLIDDDDCSDDCVAPRIVFVTTATYSGNLGGLAGADAKCTQAAAGGLLPDNVQWLAWLSDSAKSPASRMDIGFTGHYKLTNGGLVAHGWTDLIDGALAGPIDVTESGVDSLLPSQAWSNTTVAGASAGDTHCSGWTSPLLAELGRFGEVGAADPTWTDAVIANPINCSNAFQLYCVQNSALP